MKPTNDTSPSTMSKPSGSKSLIYNPAFRSGLFQIIAVAALVFFFYTIINNALILSPPPNIHAPINSNALMAILMMKGPTGFSPQPPTFSFLLRRYMFNAKIATPPTTHNKHDHSIRYFSGSDTGFKSKTMEVRVFACSLRISISLRCH